MVVIDNLRMNLTYKSGYADPHSAEFVGFAKDFEVAMMRFIKASTGVGVLGVQVWLFFYHLQSQSQGKSQTFYFGVTVSFFRTNWSLRDSDSSRAKGT